MSLRFQTRFAPEMTGRHRILHGFLFLVLLSGVPGAGCTAKEDTSTNDNAVVAPESQSHLDRLFAAADSVRRSHAVADTSEVSEVGQLAEAISSLAASIGDYNRAQNRSETPRDVTLGQAGQAVQHYGIRIFITILFLVATYFFVKGLTFVLDKISEISAERRLFYKRLVPLTRVIVWSITLYFVIKVVFEVNTQNLLAAAAAVGIAVGFAAQDIVKNIFGGFIIISDRPFQVGDKILIDGTYGEVTAIGLRSTRIVTPDDSVVSVPNAQVISSQVSNSNSGALDCQVVTDLYLPGWVDEARAKRIAYEAAATSKYVYLQKPITVLVKDEFRETFLTHIKVKAYVLDTRYEFLLMSDITERARIAFREEGMLRDVFAARAYVDLSSLPGLPGGARSTFADNPDPTDA